MVFNELIGFFLWQWQCRRDGKLECSEYKSYNSEDPKHYEHSDKTPEHILLAAFLNLFVIELSNKLDNPPQENNHRNSYHKINNRVYDELIYFVENV